MKARISVLSKNQQKKALAEIDKMTDEVIEKKMAQVTRRLLKLVCHVLNEHFRFGKHRLSLVINEIGKLSTEHDDDELFYEHLDRIVIDYLGLPFEREQEENEIDKVILERTKNYEHKK